MNRTVPEESTEPLLTGDRDKERGDSRLRRGLRILELLALEPATASDLAGRIGVNRSTALRVLQEMEAYGYVMRRPDKRYVSVAPRLLSLVPQSREQSDWRDTINPMLIRLRDDSDEAVNFSVPADGSMVYMSYFPSTHEVTIRERAGRVRPMHCSAIGMAYLAALGPVALDAQLVRLSFDGGTDNAVKGPLELRERLDTVRKLGYAVDDQESAAGVICVAAPVRLHGSLIGAAGLSAPTSRLTVANADRVGRHLLAVLSDIP